MLRLSTFEFLVRSIPEVFIFMFAAYAFSNTKIDKKIYIISSFLLGIIVFGIRFLPINYGVHTILNIIAMTIISTKVSNINIVKAIKSSLITAILLFVAEAINVTVIRIIFKENFESLLLNPISKTITGLPSLLIITIIVIVYYKFSKKEDNTND